MNAFCFYEWTPLWQTDLKENICLPANNLSLAVVTRFATVLVFGMTLTFDKLPNQIKTQFPWTLLKKEWLYSLKAGCKTSSCDTVHMVLSIIINEQCRTGQWPFTTAIVEQDWNNHFLMQPTKMVSMSGPCECEFTPTRNAPTTKDKEGRHDIFLKSTLAMTSQRKNGNGHQKRKVARFDKVHGNYEKCKTLWWFLPGWQWREGCGKTARNTFEHWNAVKAFFKSSLFDAKFQRLLAVYFLSFERNERQALHFKMLMGCYLLDIM